MTMTPGDVAAVEFLKIAEVAVHKALVFAEHPKVREFADAAKLSLEEAQDAKADRSSPRPVKRVHHLRPAPAPGTQDGLGPVA